MKLIIFNIFFVLMSGQISSNATNTPSVQNTFKKDQLKYPRVRDAYEKKESRVKKYCSQAGLDYGSLRLYLRVLKKEKRIEVYARDKTKTSYVLLKKYDVCAASGVIGPKRKQGDKQVPEGFYHIDRFNPSSTFHLSLGLNYPNSADKKKTTAKDPGGDIFIHGNCVSIGCMALTDDIIKELYLMCVQAKYSGQGRIPVHIFPFNMNRYENLILMANYDSRLLKFWKTLKPVYEQFDLNKKVPSVSISSNGDYQLQ